jgi:YD repeat-containing protein
MKMWGMKALAAVAAGTLMLVAAQSADAGQTTYQYDELGRVIQVNYPDGSVIKYAYDAAGNRISVTRTAGNSSGGTWGTMVWGTGKW